MTAHPGLLIAAHPTRGIDVGAQAAVWEELRKARSAGLAVLLVSADLDELIGLSDTLYVVFRGRLVARLDPATVTPEELGSAMTGATEHPGAAPEPPPPDPGPEPEPDDADDGTAGRHRAAEATDGTQEPTKGGGTP
jgi:simple sugar transport system ATP-binding protein